MKNSSTEPPGGHQIEKNSVYGYFGAYNPNMKSDKKVMGTF